MRISATEEYGLRILMRIARAGDEGMNIPQLSTAEGLSEPYAGKLTRLLRLSGFIRSTRGQKGGYVLAQTPENIMISAVLQALDGRMFDDDFCENHSGMQTICTHSVDCSVKSLWKRSTDIRRHAATANYTSGYDRKYCGFSRRYTQHPPGKRDDHLKSILIS